MIAIQLSSSHLKSFVDANKVIVTPIDVNQDIVKVAKSIRLEMEPSTTKKLTSTGDDAEREEKWTEAVIRESLSEWTSSFILSGRLGLCVLVFAYDRPVRCSGTKVPYHRTRRRDPFSENSHPCLPDQGDDRFHQSHRGRRRSR